ncbi:MAG: calcium-binding protein [Chloroflexota bacterium]
MKKTVATLLALVAGCGAALAHAETEPTTVVLAGGAAQNKIRIWPTPDGYSYVIDSATPLEVGGTICTNPPENPNELICEAPPIAGFVVNCGSHDDEVTVSRDVRVPVTLHGAAGNDVLRGGGAADKIVGGPGDDLLVGRGGNDVIYGGPGNDVLKGGPGNDVLRGGPGHDVLQQARSKHRKR